MSHLHADGGYLKCELSKNNGDTWLTLGTYNGYSFSWTQYAYSYAALNALGVSVGDSCVLRFVMNAEYGYGWSGFPDWGFAVDDIAVSGADITGHSGWTPLSSALPSTSYAVPARTNGVYAYRVRAYSNSAWQPYGDVAETTVILPRVTLSLQGNPMAEAGGAALVVVTLSQLAPVPVVVNIAFTGTATTLTDYTASASSIYIPAGNPSGTLSLTSVQDSIDETNETVIADIASVINGEETGTQQVTATIIDDDAPPGSFEEWVRLNCPGMPLSTAFTNDCNQDGIPDGFDYAFGANLSSNEPLIAIFLITNTPAIDIPKQLTSTVSYVDILIASKSNLAASVWSTNVTTHAIDATNEPYNRSWHAPNVIGSNGFFKLRGYLK